MFAHERSLVEKYEGKPFVLLGVNTDDSLEKLQQAQKKYDLNWRSWWDGMNGPITLEWKVPGLPYLYLIDHKGLVRWENFGAPQPKVLDQLIEQLVREAEADRPKQ